MSEILDPISPPAKIRHKIIVGVAGQGYEGGRTGESGLCGTFRVSLSLR